MTRRLALLLVVAPAALAAAGCGGGSGPVTPVATNSVDLPKSYKFEPAAIEVKAGTSVTWTNHDNFTHTVKVEDGPDHKLDRGSSVTISFPKPGTYHYLCTLHPHDMKGEVIVK
jgi:plastocyanin